MNKLFSNNQLLLIRLLLGITIALVYFMNYSPTKANAANIITVNSTEDSLMSDGVCSLREAIKNANEMSETTKGDCNPGGYSTMIQFSSNLAGQSINLTQIGDESIGHSAFSISKDITIVGDAIKGIRIVRDVNASQMRLFVIQTTGQLTLENVTISDFIALGKNGSYGGGGGGGAAGFGGAIYNKGQLTVKNSAFTNNKAQGGNGGGQGNSLAGGGGGGGQLGDGGPGSSTSSSTSNPRVGGLGGLPRAATYTLTGGDNGIYGGGGYGGYGYNALSAVAQNGGDGGFGGGGGGGGANQNGCGGDGGDGGFGGGGGGAGAYNPSGYCYARSESIPGIGGFGGGSGSLMSNDGYIRAGAGGGGAGMGGVIFQESGKLNLLNVTFSNNHVISGNSALGLGSAIFIYNGELQANFITASNNKSSSNSGAALYLYNGTININNSILFNNSISNDTDTLDVYKYGGSLQGSNNIIGKNTNVPNAMIKSSGDPLLGTFQNNGGPTSTFALSAGSAAIDSGSTVGAPATDQRGVERTNPDIGAFEYVSEGGLKVTLKLNSAYFRVGTPVNFTVEVKSVFPWGSIPNGNVTVSDGFDSCNVSLVNGQGTCSIIFNSIGSKSVSATLQNGGQTISSNVIDLVIQKEFSKIQVVNVTPSTSIIGQDVTFNVQVSPSSFSNLEISGTITVISDDQECTATLSNNTAHCTVKFNSAGSKEVFIHYNGNQFFDKTVTRVYYDVGKVNPIIQITSKDKQSTSVGEAFTVTAKVESPSQQLNQPTGTVVIEADANGVNESCSATLNNGIASCSLILTDASQQYSLTAYYEGDAIYNSKSSATISHTVNKFTSEITITGKSKDVSTIGEIVTVNYKVTVPAGATITNGTVVVSDGTVSCTGSISNEGLGSCSLEMTSSGDKAITATYNGEQTSILPSTSEPISHVVNKADTSTEIIQIDQKDQTVDTFIVKVKVQANVGTPVGEVLVETEKESCIAQLTNGTGNCELKLTEFDIREVTAKYSENERFIGSISDKEIIKTVPDKPTNIQAVGGVNEATITFDTPNLTGGSEITSYTVTSNPGGITATGSGSPIVIKGLTNGVNYTFTVTATNAIGDSLASNVSNSVTPKTIPSKPSIESVIASDSEVTVHFNESLDDGGSPITSYTVKSEPDGITATGTNSPIIVSGLENGKEYSFTIIATNEVGQSAPSNESEKVIPKSNAKQITKFSFSGLSSLVESVIHEDEKKIFLAVPFDTDIQTLIPVIEHTGVNIEPSNQVAQDFTKPVRYRITAENDSYADYEVFVTKIPKLEIEQKAINFTNVFSMSFKLLSATAGSFYKYRITSDNNQIEITGNGTINSENIQIENINVEDLADGTLTLQLEITDAYGVIKKSIIQTIRKDVVTPTGTIVYSTTNPTNADVEVKIETSEAVEITNNNGEFTHLFEENGEFTFEFVDLAGNKGTATAIVNNIDKTLPRISGVADGGIYNTAVTIDFDKGTATLNDKKFTNGSTIVDNGEYKIIVTDDAGNVSRASFMIDTIAPTVSFLPDGDEELKSSHTVNVSIADNSSGFASAKYQWSTNESFPTAGEWTTFESGQNIKLSNRNGIYFLHVEAFDFAGNKVEVTSKPFSFQYIPYSGGGVPPIIETAPSIEKLIDTGGGSISFEGSKIILPPNAVKGLVTIKAEKVTSLPTSAKPENGNIISEVLEFTKDVKGEFSEPIVLEFSFNKKGVDRNKYNVSIYWLNETTNNWIKLDDVIVDWDNGKVSGKVNHFTKFAVIAAERQTVSFSDVKGHWAEKEILRLVDAGAVNGFSDGSFKPNNRITRAQFTSILVKALKLESNDVHLFTDTTKHWAKNAISTAYQYGIIKGVEDGSFRPDDFITREQMAAMIVKAFKLELQSTSKTFKDQQKISKWALESIKIAVEHGIIRGYNDGTFKPKSYASRASAAAMIIRALEVKKTLE